MGGDPGHSSIALKVTCPLQTTRPLRSQHYEKGESRTRQVPANPFSSGGGLWVRPSAQLWEMLAATSQPEQGPSAPAQLPLPGKEPPRPDRGRAGAGAQEVRVRPPASRTRTS